MVIHIDPEELLVAQIKPSERFGANLETTKSALGEHEKPDNDMNAW